MSTGTAFNQETSGANVRQLLSGHLKQGAGAVSGALTSAGRQGGAVERRPPQIRSLTGLRIFPAFLVVYYHSQHHFSFLPDLSAITYPHAVTFFFLLSGFILAYNYWELPDRKSVVQFYFARVARMWPAHAFTLLLIVLLVPEVFALTKDTTSIFFANLFLMHAWIPSWRSYFSYNSPAWSNSTEFSFYFLFPILLWCLKKRWWVPIALTGSIAMALIVYCTINHLPECDPGGGLSGQALTYINPLSRVVEFVVGMSAAIAWKKLRNFNPGVLLGTILEICAVAFLCFVNVYSVELRHAILSTIGLTAAMWLQNCGVAIVSCFVLFLVFSLQRGLLSKAFNLPFFVILGEMSFAVYMLHSVILAYRGINFPADQNVPAYIMFWLTLLIGAHLLWTLVERPMRKVIISSGNFLLSKLPSEKDFTSNDKKKSAARKQSKFSLQNALITTEVVAFVFIVYFSLPTINKISAAEAQELSAETNALHVDLPPYLRCTAASARKSNGVVSVSIVWQAMRSGKVDFRINVTGIDKNGAPVSQVSFILDPRRQQVAEGTFWRDSFTLPSSNANAAKRIKSVTIEIAKGWRPLTIKPLTLKI